MLLKNAPKPEDTISDSATADRVPVGHRVDRQHGFAEPAFRLRGDRNGRQRRTHLEQGIDIITVELPQRRPDICERHLCDEARRLAAQSLYATNLKSSLRHIPPNHLI